MHNNLQDLEIHDTSKKKSPNFKFSIDNPPSIEILRKHIYLVHATKFLPKDDILYAQARDNTKDKKYGDFKTPSFRPTLHFSMWEVFQEWTLWWFTRKDMSYAILVPLKTVEKQLFNIFPNDTIVIGDFQLDDSCIIVIPEKEIYKWKWNIVKYNPEVESLSEIVNKIIVKNNGWQMHTNTFLDGPHSFASQTTINDINIGDYNFFSQLFNKYPLLSYGSHFQSEKGHAWRTWIIDYKIIDIINKYSDTLQNQISTTELLLWKKIIHHNLNILDNLILNSNYPQQVKLSYERERINTNEWLNVIDIDLKFRKEQGKTLTNLRPEIWKQIKNNKAFPEKMINIAQNNIRYLEKTLNLSTDIYAIADTLANMSKDEFEFFLKDNKDNFTYQENEKLKLLYASKRWLIIKTELANQEKLEEYFNLITPEWVNMIFNTVKPFLTYECNRLDTALDILWTKSILEVLSQEWWIKIKKFEKLSDLIKNHPTTSILFEPIENHITFENVYIYLFINEIEEYSININSKTKNYISFIDAEYNAIELRNNIKNREKLIQDITQPMNTTRNLDKIGWGNTLTYYKIFKKNNENIEDFWRKLWLGEQFRKMFPTDDIFWNSSYSIVNIYKELKNI